MGSEEPSFFPAPPGSVAGKMWFAVGAFIASGVVLFLLSFFLRTIMIFAARGG